MSQTDQDDEQVGKAYDRVLMKRLLGYLRPYRKYIAVSVVLLLGVAGLRLVGPYLTKIAIDTYIENGDVNGLHLIGMFYIGSLVLTFLLRFSQIYLTNLAGQQVMYDVRMAIYRHLNRLSLKYFDKNPVGRLITRVTNDIEALNEMFSSGVVNIFGDIFTLLGIIIAMVWLDYRLALIEFGDATMPRHRWHRWTELTDGIPAGDVQQGTAHHIVAHARDKVHKGLLGVGLLQRRQEGRRGGGTRGPDAPFR